MIEKIETKTLTKEELENLGIFYLTTKGGMEYDEQKAISNVFLGWYVQNLLNEEKEKNISKNE